MRRPLSVKPEQLMEADGYPISKNGGLDPMDSLVFRLDISKQRSMLIRMRSC